MAQDETFEGPGSGKFQMAGNLRMKNTSALDTLRADKGFTEATGIGAAAGTGVVAKEVCIGGIHQTQITLTNAKVPIVSVTTGAGVGGLKIYDFPAGYIRRMGCTADLAVSVATADQADFTDGTPEGDLGVGSVAPANADALGTDATDDDWATAGAFTLTAFAAGTYDGAPEAAANIDGTSTAADLYLNALVDAGDIDDDTSSDGLTINGTITVTWMNFGDY